jgi:hypothetical protein
MTRHLMIIQLHTKYHKSNSKDKSVTAEQGCLSIKRISRRKSHIKTIRRRSREINTSNSLAVLRVFLPVREQNFPSRVIFLLSVSDWIFERS